MFDFALLYLQEVLTQQVPYANLTKDVQIMRELMEGRTPLVHREISALTQLEARLWTCCRKCWQISPSMRPKAIELIKDLQSEI